MTFITEEIIEGVGDTLGLHPERYGQLVEEFQASQPELMAFLVSDDTSFLTVHERDYLLYLGLVIWEAVRQKNPKIALVKAEQIGKAEDTNWQKLEAVKARTFRERMDVFFVDYPQEDLLAFVEDVLTPDEESPITKEGREALFVALKTLIDVIAVEQSQKTS